MLQSNLRNRHPYLVIPENVFGMSSFPCAFIKREFHLVPLDPSMLWKLFFFPLNLIDTCFIKLLFDVVLSCSLFPMQRLFSLAKESGRNAAKYIIKEFPHFFDKILAEPNIPVSFLLFSLYLCVVR